MNPPICKQHQSNHDQNIIKYCISQDCNLLSSICASCQKNHNHDQLHTIQIHKFQNSIHSIQISLQQQNKINQLKNSLAIIQNSILTTFSKLINNIFQSIHKKITNYQQHTPSTNLSTKKGSEMRSIYMTQNHKKNIDPKLIKQVLENKIILKEIIAKLNDFCTFISLFDIYNISNQNLNKKINFNHIQTHIALIKFDKDDAIINSNYPQTLKQLKKINQTIYKTKLFNQALLKADEVILYNPLNHNGYFQKAYIYFQQEKYVQSFINYGISIEFQGNLHFCHNNRGLCLHNMKIYNDAICHFQKAIQINKRYPNSYLNKGVSYQYTQRYYEALACYNKALSIQKSNKNAQYHKNQVLKLIQIAQESITYTSHE